MVILAGTVNMGDGSTPPFPLLDGTGFLQIRKLWEKKFRQKKIQNILFLIPPFPG